MDHNNVTIENFLANLKAEGKSSPCDWHQFHQFLTSKKLPGQPPPPVPLILAASDESNATKHIRLGEQLQWASINLCLDDVISYLKSISPEQWNTCSIEDWYKDSYPKF